MYDDTYGDEIFTPHGRMNIPGFSCKVCKCPFPREELHYQDGRYVCERHLRPLSYRELDSISRYHSEQWELEDGPTYGGNTGP